MARGTDYTPEIGDELCLLLLQTDEQGRCYSLRRILRDKNLAMSTVFGWLRDHEDFRSKYTRAREIQAEIELDSMNDIADDGRNDWMERLGADGENKGWVANGESVARSKLRLEQRRWYASKLLPKKYGDKVQTELSGSVGVTIQATPTDENL
jgi:hypothetical protein